MPRSRGRHTVPEDRTSSGTFALQTVRREEKAAISQPESRYSMIIQWSERDQVYVVSLPEWEARRGLIGHTHGARCAEAVRMGKEMLALLVESALASGEPLPEPQVYASVS